MSTKPSPESVDTSIALGRELREQKLGQRGKVLWFTGLSGSGKTTLTRAVEWELYLRDLKTARIDGDIIRNGLNRDLGFSPGDRSENIRRCAEVARILLQSGLWVLVATISPSVETRETAMRCVGREDLLHFHVDTPLSVCESRDPKGLYKKARAGLIPDFTGISAPYIRPKDADFQISTQGTVEESLQAVLSALHQRGLLETAARRGDYSTNP